MILCCNIAAILNLTDFDGRAVLSISSLDGRFIAHPPVEDVSQVLMCYAL